MGPHANRQTYITENITFPQTMHVGGNKLVMKTLNRVSTIFYCLNLSKLTYDPQRQQRLWELSQCLLCLVHSTTHRSALLYL